MTNLDSLTLSEDLIVNGDLTVLGTSNIAGVSLVDLTTTGNTVLGNSSSDTVTITGSVDVINASTSNAIFINQTGVIAASRSVGGALLVSNGTTNTGNAAVFYSDVGNTSTGRIVHITADNTAFAHEALYVESDSLTTTTIGVQGNNNAQGVIKIDHTAQSGSSADANASAISIDLQGSAGSSNTTAAMGLFLTSTTGGTTGKLLNLRNNLLAFGGANSQVELLTFTGDGKMGLQSSSPVGKFDMNGTLTVASAAAAVLDDFGIRASTITITGATNIVTAAGFNYASIKAPTYSAASALTITNAATLYISNAPSGGGAGPATITNAYSVWIDAGLPRIDSTTANGAVATVLGSVGPVGSNTTVQEWLTININGNTRYIPCF